MIKKYLPFIITILLVSLIAFSELNYKYSEKGERVSLSKLEEFHQRDGLFNIFHKISTQRQIRIAYFGGSITVASEGWRDLAFIGFALITRKRHFIK